MTEPQEKIVIHRALATAEDLFRELSPATGELWRIGDEVEAIDSHLTRWLFRGQANDCKARAADLDWTTCREARHARS